MSKSTQSFVIINDWIKLDCENDAFVSRKPIPKGTRILIERPLFQIGKPPKYEPIGNALFLFSKFKALPQDAQNEIIIQTLATLERMYGSDSVSHTNDKSEEKNEKSKGVQKQEKEEKKYKVGDPPNGHLRVLFPLRRINNNIGKLLSTIKNTIKRDNISKYISNDFEWKKLETLLNIFEQYSIDLQYSDTYNENWLQNSNLNKANNKSIAYYNDGTKSQNKESINYCYQTNEDCNDGSNWDNDECNLGKALFRFVSRFEHSCLPTCNVNVIDEIGTIEVRTIMNINKSNVILSRNYLFNKTFKDMKNEYNLVKCKKINLLNYFGKLNCFDSNMVIPRYVRQELLLQCYHFECQCKMCNQFDKTRAFLCKNINNNDRMTRGNVNVNKRGKNGGSSCRGGGGGGRRSGSIGNNHNHNCQGIVLCKPLIPAPQSSKLNKNKQAISSKSLKNNNNNKHPRGGSGKSKKQSQSQSQSQSPSPPVATTVNVRGDKIEDNGLIWQCMKCHDIISKESMAKLLEIEEKLESRLIGIESIIDFGFFNQVDTSNILFQLLDDACCKLSPNHWIVIRLLWLCFKISKKQRQLSLSLIYLKRHIELTQSIGNQFGILTTAPKCQLLADLLPMGEMYKTKAMETAIERQSVLRGQDHTSVKASKQKLAVLEREMHGIKHLAVKNDG